MTVAAGLLVFAAVLSSQVLLWWCRRRGGGFRRINDRGPFVRGRVIDLTPAAAHALSFSGTTEVSLAVVGGK